MARRVFIIYLFIYVGVLWILANCASAHVHSLKVVSRNVAAGRLLPSDVLYRSCQMQCLPGRCQRFLEAVGCFSCCSDGAADKQHEEFPLFQ